ncbi:MAG: ABC transporter ATP-binding protein [Tahibacter sp.]
MDCLQTIDLVHRYGSQTVLDGVNLRVPVGSIYGFLGPNGAGKTTTMRVILGLLARQHGDIVIFGQSMRTHRVAILRRVGTLIESPSIYEHLTATENLALLQKIYQCPVHRIAEVLALVGLSGTGSKRAGRFSLGMKQRLSIAIAMLHDPQLLVLDEPTNGLDPNGIAEIRELLRHLNDEHGTTILVSSHLLAEIDRLVTHVGIIDHGKMRFQGTMAELKNLQHTARAVALRTGDDHRATQILVERGLHPTYDGKHIALPPIADHEIAALNRHLVERNIDVHEISVQRNDLEAIFMDLIGART